jgi:hypothetical protein
MMKVNIVDVAHEEIADRCDEFVLISCEYPDSSDGYISRVNVNTDGETLKEILVDTMLNSKDFSRFVQEVLTEYNKQNQ